MCALLLVGTLLAGGALAGCGQKGALYLPTQKKAKVPATTAPAPTKTTQPAPETPAPESTASPPA
jgi:predicted small lipoprotein YifL